MLSHVECCYAWKNRVKATTQNRAGAYTEPGEQQQRSRGSAGRRKSFDRSASKYAPPWQPEETLEAWKATSWEQWARNASGHAISGLADLQLPSLVAVVGFLTGGLFTRLEIFLVTFLHGSISPVD